MLMQKIFGLSIAIYFRTQFYLLSQEISELAKSCFPIGYSAKDKTKKINLMNSLLSNEKISWRTGKKRKKTSKRNYMFLRFCGRKKSFRWFTEKILQSNKKLKKWSNPVETYRLNGEYPLYRSTERCNFIPSEKSNSIKYFSDLQIK